MHTTIDSALETKTSFIKRWLFDLKFAEKYKGDSRFLKELRMMDVRKSERGAKSGERLFEFWSERSAIVRLIINTDSVLELGFEWYDR